MALYLEFQIITVFETKPFGPVLSLQYASSDEGRLSGLRGHVSGKKVDIWAKWNITLLSGLPVYLWIDTPSIPQDKEKCPFLFKSLGCNASSPNSLDFASHDFPRPYICAFCCFLLGSRSDWVPPCCLLILWMWMLNFLWNNSWAVCSYRVLTFASPGNIACFQRSLQFESVPISDYIFLARVCFYYRNNHLSCKNTLERLNICWLNMIDLTLKAPITTAADDKFCNIFPNFQRYQQTILMKYHVLFDIFEKASKFEIVSFCKL